MKASSFGFFCIEQYYSEYYPQMREETPTFVTMVSCHLDPTPMNFYRKFSLECQRTNLVKTRDLFTTALRKRFLPPDFEYMPREKLYNLKQVGTIHDYVASFHDFFVQCRMPLSPPMQAKSAILRRIARRSNPSF